MMTFTEFKESGLYYPWGIAIGLGIMVAWNLYFISQALATAPEVDAAYVDATHR